MDDRLRAVLQLSEQHEGLITVTAFRATGLSREALRHQLRCGAFERYGPRLLRRSGAPPTAKQRLLGAVLDAGPGAYLSYGCAVAWWGLPGFDLRHLDVTRP